jgi:uncharacterized GH25 family protein
MRFPRISIAFAFALLAASLFAHETWIAPNQGYIAPGLPVRLDLSSSGKFPILETAIEPARLGKFGVRLGDEVLKPVVSAGPKSLKFHLTPSKEKEGFATAFVSLKPRKLTLTAAQVEEYLEEIGQTAVFLEKWKARPEPRTWREEYTKHAKAFFRVGKASDESWKTPVGVNLEIVPLSDPTRASSSEPFRVQVLRAGQPLVAFAMVALIDSTTPRQFATTGADGVAAFTLNRQGRWLIEGTDLRETTKAGLDFESDFATLLVTVSPAKAQAPRAK